MIFNELIGSSKKMQCIKQCLQRFVSTNIYTTCNSNYLCNVLKPLYTIPSSNIHGSPTLADSRPKKFIGYNKVIFPPQKPGEERRPAYVCHMKENIKYSPLKMWYIACFIRGMTVDEAVKQLSFQHRKGAFIVKDILLEAQKLAVEEHNVEFKTNLWVAESFVTKGMILKGIRRHGRLQHGTVHYRYCHYFVRLEEGKPPKQYYLSAPKSGEELLQEWMNYMRNRKVCNSL